MAYDPKSMKVHELNESLSFVFKLCDGTNSCEDLAVELMKRYDLDVETASRETYRALKILADDQLIEAQ